MYTQEEGHVMEAETAVICLEASEWQRLAATPGAVRKAWNRSFPKAFMYFFFNKFIYLFIFGCVGSLLLRAGFL